MAEAVALVASILTISVGIIEGIKYAKAWHRATGELEALQVETTGETLLPPFYRDGQTVRS